MKSFWKLLAVVTLTAIAVPALAHASEDASGSAMRAVAMAWMCDCCPRTCLGGTLTGCFNNTSMPPNAVTCSYIKPDGSEFYCVSCLAKATTAEQAFLQSLSSD